MAQLLSLPALAHNIRGSCQDSRTHHPIMTIPDPMRATFEDNAPDARFLRQTYGFDTELYPADSSVFTRSLSTCRTP